MEEELPKEKDVIDTSERATDWTVIALTCKWGETPGLECYEDEGQPLDSAGTSR